MIILGDDNDDNLAANNDTDDATVMRATRSTCAFHATRFIHATLVICATHATITYVPTADATTIDIIKTDATITYATAINVKTTDANTTHAVTP